MNVIRLFKEKRTSQLVEFSVPEWNLKKAIAQSAGAAEYIDFTSYILICRIITTQ